MFRRSVQGTLRQAGSHQVRMMALRAPSNSIPTWVPDIWDMPQNQMRKATLQKNEMDPLVAKLRAKDPVRVAVTGPAGAIGYALLFRLCNGEMLGPDQPIHLNLLELPPMMDKLKGVAMEIDDCAFPLVKSITQTDNAEKAFSGIDIALLVGSKPRGPGMERQDLIKDNGVIFQKLGQALDAQAEKHVRVTVVGNPCNTNAMIAANNAPSLDVKNFTAMTRLDHDRTVGMLAQKAMLPPNEINKVAVWGNHSATMYPDILFSEIHGMPMQEFIGHYFAERYVKNEVVPTIQQRGAQIIKARGSSSAASAANAAIAHTRDWCLGTEQPDWVSMGVVSGGEFGVPPGLVFSFPTWCVGGGYEIVNYPSIPCEYNQWMIEKNIVELEAERDMVASLLPN